ncbi:MAG: LysR family transcriptional regulator [Variovorax sp.]|nr:LysR family transcriptional regulator [Variovorax sp.]
MADLPPLNPLHVFSVVARCSNLVKAAEELGVTQSAVSRQISGLEQHFGCKLFRRTRYGLDLLPVAEVFAQKVTAAFDAIGSAAHGLQVALSHAEQTITIKTYTSLAASWLIPRLPDFCKRHPNIKIVIKTGAKSIDFGKNEGDLSIQILNRQTKDAHATLLYQDVIEPVCSPEFLRRHAPNPKYPSSLLRQTVIASEYRQFEWETWNEHSGFGDDYAPASVMNFGNALLGWDAAARGIGIAMGQTKLLADKIASGQLVTPFDAPVNTQKSYFVVLPKDNVKEGAVLFREWLLQQF